MTERQKITQYLLNHESFTSGDFINMLKESGAGYSDRKAYRQLQIMQDTGEIMKVGRGHYTKVSVKGGYRFSAA